MLRKRQYREKLISSLHSQTIDKQHELTVSADKFFKSCQLASPLSQYSGLNSRSDFTSYMYNQNWEQLNYKINCSSLGFIYETISYEFKCFTLFRNRSSLNNYYKDINYQIPRDVAIYLKYLAWIELNRDFMFNGLIYIHSPERKCINGLSSIIIHFLNFKIIPYHQLNINIHRLVTYSSWTLININSLVLHLKGKLRNYYRNHIQLNAKIIVKKDLSAEMIALLNVK